MPVLPVYACSGHLDAHQGHKSSFARGAPGAKPTGRVWRNPAARRLKAREALPCTWTACSRTPGSP
eukprot:10226006-Lingulodinium_polyedra.AAC.1